MTYYVTGTKISDMEEAIWGGLTERGGEGKGELEKLLR